MTELEREFERFSAHIKNAMSAVMPMDFLFSSSQAAEYLGCSRDTISRYLKKGRLNKESRGVVTGIPFRQLKALKDSRG